MVIIVYVLLLKVIECYPDRYHWLCFVIDGYGWLLTAINGYS